MPYATMQAPPQTAGDIEPLLSCPAAAVRCGPIVMDDDWVARNRGWSDHASMRLAILDLEAHAWIVDREKASIGQPACCAEELEEGLYDRVMAGALVLRAMPEWNRDVALRETVRYAARAAWREILTARRDAAEMADEIEASRAHRYAELFEAA